MTLIDSDPDTGLAPLEFAVTRNLAAKSPAQRRSARPSTMAADPEPRVRVANWERRSAAVVSSAASRSSVSSWV